MASVGGDSECTRVEIKLDAPDSAVRLSYGVSLNGPGSVCIDSVHSETFGNAQLSASKTVPVIYNPPPRPSELPTKPVNLDFED